MYDPEMHYLDILSYLKFKKPFWSYVQSKLKTKVKIPTLIKLDGTKAYNSKEKALDEHFGSVYQNEPDNLPPAIKPFSGIPLMTIEITHKIEMEKLNAFVLIKKALVSIDAAFAQRAEASSKPSLIKPGYASTFGLYARQDGHLAVGSTLVQIDGKTFLKVDDTEYQLTPCLIASIMQKITRNAVEDFRAYKSLVAQIKVKSSPNRAGIALHAPHD